jgi:hypothetical protein
LAALVAVVFPEARFAGPAVFVPDPLAFLAGGRFAAGFLAAGFAAFFVVALPDFFFGTGFAGFFAVDFFPAPFLAALRTGAAFLDPAVFGGVAITSSQRGDGRRRSRQRAGERRIVGANTVP